MTTARYQVRAAFDNAAFLVTGEDVRVAGAKVGEVSEVLVSDTDEIVSCPDVQAASGRASRTAAGRYPARRSS